MTLYLHHPYFISNVFGKIKNIMHTKKYKVLGTYRHKFFFFIYNEYNMEQKELDSYNLKGNIHL